MRKIKFRAWKSWRKPQMLYDNAFKLEWSEKNRRLEANCHWRFDASYNMPLMQFTGLKDKKGKEIYEGDIVSFEYDPNEFEKYKVSWGTATFYAESLEDAEYNNSLWDMPRENMEVIGNVYENPELLKGGD